MRMKRSELKEIIEEVLSESNLMKESGRDFSNADPEKYGKAIAKDIGMPVNNWAGYSDGFSFTTPKELDAYKAAYAWQHVKRVNVKKAGGPAAKGEWLVQIKTK